MGPHPAGGTGRTGERPRWTGDARVRRDGATSKEIVGASGGCTTPKAKGPAGRRPRSRPVAASGSLAGRGGARGRTWSSYGRRSRCAAPVQGPGEGARPADGGFRTLGLQPGCPGAGLGAARDRTSSRRAAAAKACWPWTRRGRAGFGGGDSRSREAGEVPGRQARAWPADRPRCGHADASVEVVIAAEGLEQIQQTGGDRRDRPGAAPGGMAAVTFAAGA